MKKDTYSLLENYMISCMEDSAHDREHIYRVLYVALEIAQTEKNVDYDVLICACLLHDIGRKEQFENPELCHAQVGAAKAYDYLLAHGFKETFASHVRDCIRTHRYRNSAPPESIEAKILFDADKVDVTGATGIARTLIYKGQVSEPLYSVGTDGQILDGKNDKEPSFFQEYKYKLENLYEIFFTEKGREIALKRREAAKAFYDSVLEEVCAPRKRGKGYLEEYLGKENVSDGNGGPRIFGE